MSGKGTASVWWGGGLILFSILGILEERHGWD